MKNGIWDGIEFRLSFLLQPPRVAWRRKLKTTFIDSAKGHCFTLSLISYASEFLLLFMFFVILKSIESEFSLSHVVAFYPLLLSWTVLISSFSTNVNNVQICLINSFLMRAAANLECTPRIWLIALKRFSLFNLESLSESFLLFYSFADKERLPPSEYVLFDFVRNQR